MNTGRKLATTSGGLVKTSVQIRPDRLAVIDRLVEDEGLSRSAIIARLIDIGLRTQTTSAPEPAKVGAA